MTFSHLFRIFCDSWLTFETLHIICYQFLTQPIESFSTSPNIFACYAWQQILILELASGISSNQREAHGPFFCGQNWKFVGFLGLEKGCWPKSQWTIFGVTKNNCVGGYQSCPKYSKKVRLFLSVGCGGQFKLKNWILEKRGLKCDLLHLFWNIFWWRKVIVKWYMWLRYFGTLACVTNLIFGAKVFKLVCGLIHCGKVLNLLVWQGCSALVVQTTFGMCHLHLPMKSRLHVLWKFESNQNEQPRWVTGMGKRKLVQIWVGGPVKLHEYVSSCPPPRTPQSLWQFFVAYTFVCVCTRTKQKT